MQNTQTTPRIYVACLAAYNNGMLHGQWIDANQSAEAIHDKIKDMLGQSPIPRAEEWAIHDYEGFCGLRLSEYQDIDTVAEMAALIQEHGEAWAKFAEYEGIEYATLEIPEHLQFYIDYEKLARDLFINDYYSADGEGCKVYVFRRL